MVFGYIVASKTILIYPYFVSKLLLPVINTGHSATWLQSLAVASCDKDEH